MRLKSFTLIEVMIASYIFMVVILMVVASFAMVRKSNENSDDSRVTSNCSRQVEDIFRSAVKSANFGKPLIKGIVYNGSKYTLISTSTSGLVGFATFEDPQDPDISKVRIKTFVKKVETTSPSMLISSYYYATSVVSLKTLSNPGADPRKDIPDGFDVSDIVNPINPADAQRINSADCSALILPGQISIKSEAGFGARSTVSVYSLIVKDKFFRSFADQSSEKRYSDVNIFVSNDAKTL